MKIPLTWLENYIKLEHNHKEFGDIMTNLEFMQDGPIEIINDIPVIDLEVRQNRPDILSIIGVAREYAAFINKKVSYPEELSNIEAKWDKSNINLQVKATDDVVRFCTVELENIKISDSPDWIKKNLEAYGIPSINNVVDITNFVMLEYGMPLHAFDYDKLNKEENKPLLTLRYANEGEQFVTWQESKLSLSENDVVVADSQKPVAIAGIIGGANSDIDGNTKHIILESATYNQATIRKSSLRHSLRTDASSRHEKYLNPELVETAIRRALFLLNELANGEIIKIEDYYEIKQEPKIVEFNIFNIERIGGINLKEEQIIDYLNRLGFNIIEHKDAIGIEKNIFEVKVPVWRTDINYEADLIEEVLRLHGYEEIPSTPINRAPNDNSTQNVLILEDKIRSILVNFGLDEHITSPLVRFSNKDKQILLENPLNKENDALRVSIRDTLIKAYDSNIKALGKNIKVFEVGKIYTTSKTADYKEERRIESLYDIENFITEVKPNFLSLLTKLNIDVSKLNQNIKKDNITYSLSGKKIAELYNNGYVLYTENIIDIVDINRIPILKVKTEFTQKIIEEFSFVIDKNEKLGSIAKEIFGINEKITHVEYKDKFTNSDIGKNNISATFQVIFEDTKKALTREHINEIREEITKRIQKRFNAAIRK